MIVNILFFILFLMLSAFFSASETAIFSLSSFKLHKLSEKYSKARAVKTLLKKPIRLLSAIVFGNMLVNISIASLSTAIFVKAFGENGLFFAVFLSGILILFIGEVLPKTFAIHTAERLSLIVSPVIIVFSKIFYPIIIVMEKIVDSLSYFIVKKPRTSSLSDEEFKATLLQSKKDGQISAQEEKMISHVLEFKDTQASEILIPRIDIEGIDTKLSQSEILDVLRDKKHSKFPVYEGSLDNIVGILYAKEVFLNSDKDYHDFLHSPMFIPESKGIDDLLKLFLEKNERVAIVLDEYGGAEGLITFEDISEEIFGEMYDEFEKIVEQMVEISRNTWKVSGKTPIKSVNMTLNLDIPEEEDTIAGFLLSKWERIPRSNEKIEFKNIIFTIERATARRIVSIIIDINNK
ncbi:MAG: HlyC/CorC family transporter [Candidatus Omnitrophica bacterium]|nr:HlyC/CorC family transporter [Candidatus Omnitrophota bacterium]